MTDSNESSVVEMDPVPAPEPLAPEPEPLEPEPLAPEPLTPEPLTPEPPTPEPPTPEPLTPEPVQPEPVQAAAPARPTPTPIPPRPRADAATPSASREATDLLRGAVTYGRVDSDGAVYVRTADGDRRVGEFPDTAPNEALIYFVRKYEELIGQVDLFAQRLRTTDLPTRDARSGLAKLQAAVAEPAAVGDLDGLTQWVASLKSEVDRAARAHDVERNAAKAVALTEREALVAEAEQIAATPTAKLHFKTAMERLREILDEWKTRQKDGPRLDKPAEDALWKRLSAARTIIDKGRREHAAETAEQRTSTKTAKEAIIAEAQALATSTDWRSTGDAFRALMDRWKSAGRLPRHDDDELWTAFREAQEQFHAARTAAMSAQDEEYRGNLVIKEALLVEAEALLPVTNLDSAKRRLRDIQDRWDAAGRVPRSDLERVEKRLQVIADTVRQADQSRWTATNPEALARARDVVSQLETGVTKLEKELAKARTANDARGVERAQAALDARQSWLDQARTALSDLGG